MTWMPNMSLFDSASAMHLPQLAVAQKESEALLYEMVYGEQSDMFGPAPQPLLMMWYGYEIALAAYSIACCATLVQHGVSRGHSALLLAESVTMLRDEGSIPFALPPWIEDTDVLRSHRSNMMRRWPGVYSWRKTSADMPYLWPVVDERGGYELRLSKYDKELLASGERQLPNSVMERVANA